MKVEQVIACAPKQTTSIQFSLVYLIESGYFQKLMSNSPKRNYLPTLLVTSVQNFLCFQPFLYVVLLLDKISFFFNVQHHLRTQFLPTHVNNRLHGKHKLITISNCRTFAIGEKTITIVLDVRLIERLGKPTKSKLTMLHLPSTKTERKN